MLPPMSRARLRPSSLVVVAAVVAITVVLSWASWAANRSSNDRLLGQQVRQTASVLQNQIAVISAQLLDAAQAAEDTDGNAAIFKRFVGAKIGAGGPFASMTLWRQVDGQRTLLATAGVPPVLSGAAADRFFAAVRPSRNSFLTPVLPGARPGEARFGYAVQIPGDSKGFVVYAERLLPPGRHIDVPPTSPFAGLHLAVYLCRTAPVPYGVGAEYPARAEAHGRGGTR